MDPVGTPIALLALSIAGHGILWFFKTPKEDRQDMSKRMDELEDAHHELDKDYSGFRERITIELRTLSTAINNLSGVIETHLPRRPSGEHRAVR